MNEISVTELASKHAAGEPFLLLDVREPDELEIASVAFATAIPMGEVPARLGELPADRPVYVLCHSGGRSGRVTAFLNANGFASAANVRGGITAWSKLVDPTIPTY